MAVCMLTIINLRRQWPIEWATALSIWLLSVEKQPTYEKNWIKKKKQKKIHKSKWISLLGVPFKVCDCDVTLQRNGYSNGIRLMLKQLKYIQIDAIRFSVSFSRTRFRQREWNNIYGEKLLQDLCSCLSVDSVQVRCVAYFFHSSHFYLRIISGRMISRGERPPQNWYKFSGALNVRLV